MNRPILNAALALAMLTACSAPAATTTQSTATTSSATPSPALPTSSSTPTATPTPATKAVMKLGETFTGQGYTMQVTEWKPDYRVAGGSEQRDSILARFCFASTQTQPARLTWQPWALTGPAGERFAPSSSVYGDAPQPRYPNGEILVQPGECVAGYIDFEGASSAVEVRYGPANGEVARWALK